MHTRVSGMFADDKVKQAVFNCSSAEIAKYIFR